MEILKFKNLSGLNNVIHGVATAAYGNMSYMYGVEEAVQSNRRRFFTDLGVSQENVAMTFLVHGHEITDVTEADRGRGILSPDDLLGSDILVTDKPDTYLFFVVADCMALLFFDPVKEVVALAHAGWKGVEAKVPVVTVQHLQDKYGSHPSDVLVGISPSLKAESAKFKEMEQTKLPGWEPYLTKVGEYYHADISRYAYDQLIASGVPQDNIEPSPIDTRVDQRFFSHRRSDEEGLPEARFGVLIGLKPPRSPA